MPESKKYQHFIGIDVSRNKLDCTVLVEARLLFHKVIENKVASVMQFVDELRAIETFRIRRAVFGMEQTGIYTAHLLEALKKAKANIILEDSTHIKNSLGKAKGKDDKLDSLRIAKYLYRSKEDFKFWEERRPIIAELHNLAALRARLLVNYKAIQMPLEEQKDFWSADSFRKHAEICANTLLSIKTDIAKIESLLQDTVKSDDRIQRLYEVITSVPSVGPVLAIQMIVTTNEFKDIADPKKYASYAGVAPFKNESGTVRGRTKVSHIANKKLKAILHICAMSSIAHKSELQDYYFRKTKQEGKSKMAVLNAIRNKIILRVFACVHQDRLYQKNYVRQEVKCY